MRFSLNSTGGKVLASAVVLGAAATVAGLGTFGTFTSTTSASEQVASGTVAIELGAAGATNRLSVGASGLVPDDTVQRAVQLANTGTQDLAAIVLTTVASPSSKLDTDTLNGLQLSIQSCSVPWTEGGSAPAYTYSCTGGTTATVLSARPVIGANMTLSNLSSVAASRTDYLLVTLKLPTNADNTFQGLSSTVGFTFAGTQRAGLAH